MEIFNTRSQQESRDESNPTAFYVSNSKTMQQYPTTLARGDSNIYEDIGLNPSADVGYVNTRGVRVPHALHRNVGVKDASSRA